MREDLFDVDGNLKWIDFFSNYNFLGNKRACLVVRVARGDKVFGLSRAYVTEGKDFLTVWANAVGDLAQYFDVREDGPLLPEMLDTWPAFLEKNHLKLRTVSYQQVEPAE